MAEKDVGPSDSDNSSFLESIFGSGDGPIRALLKDTEVRDACLIALEDIGCRKPLNSVVLFCFEKVLLGSASFFGVAAKNNLVGFLGKFQPMRNLLQKITQIASGNKNKNDIRDTLLAELNVGLSSGSKTVVDRTLDFETVSALHLGKKIDGIEDVFSKLVSEIQNELSRYFDTQFEPVLKWPPMAIPQEQQTTIQRLGYNSGHGLFGRDDALNDLHKSLAGDPSMLCEANNLRWLLITAPGGEGKTRLAKEFSDQLANAGWNAGPVTEYEIERFDANRWIPKTHTLFIIDYPAQFPKKIKELLTTLLRRSFDFDFAVRVLLLERDAEGEWFKTVFPAGTETSTLLGHSAIVGAKNGEYKLRPIEPPGIVDLLRERFSEHEELDAKNPVFLETVYRIDPRVEKNADGQKAIMPRALFAAAVAETIIEAKISGKDTLEVAATLDKENVLNGIIERERHKHWKHTRQGEDPDILLSHEYLLAIATASLGLSITEFNNLDEDKFGFLPSLSLSGRPTDNPLMKAMGASSNRFREMQPDILGEYFALSILADYPVHRQAIIDAAMRSGRNRAAIFALRCLRDFEDRFLTLGMLVPSPDAGPDAAVSFSKVFVDLSHWLGKAKKWDMLDAALDGLNGLRQKWPQNQEIDLLDAKASVKMANHAGEQKLWDRVDEAFLRLDALKQNWPEIQEIDLEDAKACFNTANHAGEQKLWDRVDEAFLRLDALKQKWPENLAIDLEDAETCFNMTKHAGQQKLWDRVDEAFLRLDALKQKWPETLTIDLEDVIACFNMAYSASQQKLWDRVDEAFLRLDALKQKWPEKQEIALLDAKACLNMTNAGVQKLWDRVDEAFLRLDALKQKWPQNQKIDLEDANASFNMANRAGEQKLWDRVDEAFLRLDALKQKWPEILEIDRLDANASFNMANRAGEQKLWDRVDEAFLRLDALKQKWPEILEIDLEDAKACFNTAKHADEQKLWGRVDEAFLRLDALKQKWPEILEIDRLDARACFNTAKHAGEQKLWDRVDEAILRLDALKQKWPEILEIDRLDANACSNIAYHAGEQKLWDRVDEAFLRLDALKQNWPEILEIDLLDANACSNIAYHAGEQKLWDRVDEAFLRLDALKQKWPQNQEIDLLDANACFNIAYHACEQKLWDRVDEAFLRLDALKQKWPEKREIDLEDAKACRSMAKHAGEQKLWDRVDEVYKRIIFLLDSDSQNHSVAEITSAVIIDIYIMMLAGERQINSDQVKNTISAASFYVKATTQPESNLDAGPSLLVLKDILKNHPEVAASHQDFQSFSEEFKQSEYFAEFSEIE